MQRTIGDQSIENLLLYGTITCVKSGKECPRCLEVFPRSKSYWHSCQKHKDGLAWWCKQCSKTYKHKHYREQHPNFMPKTSLGKFRCPRCRKYLTKEKFGICNRNKHGISSYCRNCTSERNQLPENLIKIRAWRQKWLRKHPDYAKEYYKKNPQVNLKQTLKRYDVTIADYTSLLNSQKGLCAVCGEPPASNRRFDIDHSHKSKAIRGLVHNSCNRNIGKYESKILKNPILRKQIENYLFNK